MFMSSHDLAEVERTCQQVAVIRNGTLVANGTASELSRRYQRTAIITFRGSMPDPLNQLGTIASVDRERHIVEVRIGDDINPLIRRLAEEEIASLAIREPQLQDVFFDYYGESENSSRAETGSSAPGAE